MSSERYIFVGDGFLAELGVQPVFAVVSGSRTLTITKFKPYLHHIAKLGYVNVVDDRGLFFYRMFKDETIEIRSGVVKVVKVSDMLAESKRVDGDVCELLRSVQPVFYVFKDFTTNQEKVTYALPIIVKYRNLWEHFSLAPIKVVKEAEYYLYDNAVGIAVVDRDAATKRPYAMEILTKPTSVLLAEECRLEVKLPQAQREMKVERRLGASRGVIISR